MSQPETQRKPYSGLRRKLIIAIDVGTTFSGASYALLIPGEPVIQGVTQFPGQQKVDGDSRIPTVVCYDKNGNVVAVGWETDPDTNPECLKVEGLVRAEWFNLHLAPGHLPAEQGLNVEDIPPLPRNKTVNDIFSDILRYVYKSTKEYIRERQGDGIWDSIGTNVEFILSHPNGWEGKQQSEMRCAAINAGLVATASEASERISFVTEGEASLHFCLNNIPTAFQKYANDGILVADWGGGTVDISAYARSSGKFKELAPAECLLQGSCFVSRRAQTFLTEKHRGSRFGTPESIDAMSRFFHKTTKPSFEGSSKPYFVRFGRREDNDNRSGSVELNTAEIANFCKPAIQNIIKVIEEQFMQSADTIKAIFMVGGFATSDYLFSELEDHFKTKNIDTLRPDTFLNKAVADGAIFFSPDHFVSSRVAKPTHVNEMHNIYSGTGRPTERQSMTNGPVANPIRHQPDTSPTGHHPNRTGSETNLAHRQLGTTYLPTGNALVKSDAAHRPRINDDTIEGALSRLDILNQDEIRTYNGKTQERTELQRFLRECIERERREKYDAIKTIAHERDELQKRMKIMQGEVRRMQQELHHARSIEQPDPVVVSTDAFTPHTADGVSGRDLIQDMEQLNDEILQFAALLAEQFEKTAGQRRTDLPPIPRSDVDVLHNHFGKNITTFLLQARDQQDHSWLMHAVQACIIESCKSVLTSLLPFTTWSDKLEDMYRKIRSREGQSMSGQWRSLLCRHGLNMTRTEHKVNDRIRNDVSKLCNVLGWSAQDSTHLESLKSIASRTLQLHRTINVEILSGDMSIISPELGTPFDPATMEVTEARSADAKLPVLCTTDMGLRKSAVEKVFTNEKYEFQKQKTVILKAKVFLDSSAADDGPKNNSRSS